MTKNEHVYAISCQPEVAGDVISGEHLKTVEGYAGLNFDVANFSSFQDIRAQTALSENAFAFRWKITKKGLNCHSIS